MASDLTVTDGTTVTLDEHPPVKYADALSEIKIEKLRDLVDTGVVGSVAGLNDMLKAAKTSTTAALERHRTGAIAYRPVVGRTTPDLGRYSNFIAAATTETSTLATEGFWRVVRSVDPGVIAKLGIDDKLSELSPHIKASIPVYTFNDVTVGKNATLAVGKEIASLTCHDLLIRKSGRILVEGGGVSIRAFSIQGEQ